MDSLVHGVEHHIHGSREYDRKYVILHVFHAVELFLKARLAKYDELLIAIAKAVRTQQFKSLLGMQSPPSRTKI